MLEETITIEKYDPEQVVSRIFPMLKDNARYFDAKDPVIQYFQGLGDAALPTLLTAMGKLSGQSKAELVAAIGNACEKPLCSQINQALSHHPFGKWAHVGSVTLTAHGNGLCLHIGDMQLDCGKILQENGAGLLGKFASGDKAEKMILNLLHADKSCRIPLQMADTILKQSGYDMEPARAEIARQISSSLKSPKQISLSSRLEAEMQQACGLKDQ